MSAYRPPHKRSGQSRKGSQQNYTEDPMDNSNRGVIQKQSRSRYGHGWRGQSSNKTSSNDSKKIPGEMQSQSNWRKRNDDEKPISKSNTRYQEQRSNDNNIKSYELRPNKLKRMTFTRMAQLLEEEPNTICIVLQNKDEGFITLLENDTHVIKDDWVILIIKLLEKVISSTIDMKRLIIIDACHHFIPILTKYLQNLPFQSTSERDLNKHYWRNIQSFWTALIKFCNEIVMIIPKTAIDKLPKLLNVMEMVATTFGHKPETRLEQDIIDDIDKLNEKLTILISERESKMMSGEESGSDEDEMPFGDYRDIPIIPEQHELLATRGPDIRPNIINGKYVSVYHYLDVQFRLLREDFVAPLRNGIKNYLSPDPNNKKKYDSIRIYKNVRIIGTTITKQQQFCFVVKLNLAKRQLERLEHSKRLMHGALLIFTNDTFQTIIVGTMFQKDEKTLKNSEILVDIPLDSIDLENCFNIDYIMVESEIYFEPYRHILKTLQKMDEHSFPMSNYILKSDVTSKPPAYLTEESSVKIKENFYKILDESYWTILSPEKLKYDNTQYDAFKAALTKEFCVIQGPPGTGKTFIGLEIIETLLVNNNLWYKEGVKKNGPILVVCYTNHALDQFLEGVLKVTNCVARIGGQSKNEKLNEFNIRELRKSVNRRNDFKRAAVTLQYELNNIQKEIHQLRSKLEIIYSKQPVLLDIRSELVRRNVHFNTKDKFEKWLLTRTNYNEHRLEELQFLRIMNDIDNIEIENFEDDNNKSIDNYNSSNDDQTIVDDFEVIKSLNDDQEKLQHLVKVYNNLVVQEDQRDLKELLKIQIQIQQYETMLDYLQFRFNQNVNQLPAPPQYVRNPEFLNPNQRWALYWECLSTIPQKLIRHIKELQIDYNKKLNDYSTVQQMEDLIVLRDCLVVGMTTTGAAKFRTVLEGLQSPIVIVEEAAEVLESHIVTSLTSNCKHLILIGDHKQLRPSTSVYRLAKDFNLDISLFERMIKNGMHCESLGVQHRMRPEFAQLIVPSIYPNLQNHHSVYTYPSIIGMKKNLFFIKHTHFEETVVDIDSKQNNHEADFILQLCRHLILQGYDAEDITVLTTYNGQMFHMKKLQKNIPTIQNVRITVVDNFQGEESNIILLSLVRSNEDSKIGFLATENRICVALSRAKHGFYIIGNMDQLISNDKSKWPEINAVLEQNKCIGTDLVLQCKIHKDQETFVNCAEDFKRKCPEGGCSLACNLIMPCGHNCASMCHVQDRDHTETKCLMPCSRIICERDHQCPDLCFKKCNPCMKNVDHILPCSHKATLPCHLDPLQYKCKEIITVKLECEHENKIRCSDDPKAAICTHPCATRLDCGHTCEKRCHINNDPEHEKYECRKPCEQLMVNCSANHKCDKQCYEECNFCNVIVEKRHNTCEHSQQVKCYQKIDDVSCEKKCTRKLSCGHPCVNLCGEQCEQTKCKVQVQKVIPLCGHTIKVECGKPPERVNCRRKCPLKMPCGHACNNRCDRCARQGCSTSRCTTKVDHSFVVDCKHEFKIPCYKANMRGWKSYSQDLLKHCDHPCSQQLECEHTCTGTCGDCYQGRLHQSCNSKCGLTLVCGHPCQSPCRENCPPCMAKCQFRCRHSQCKKQCGEPCTSCKEPCPWRCEHFQCTNKCGDICDREACNEPCLKLLKCNHQCIGLCGEICPDVCRVCDPGNEIFTIMFGNEDEDTSRFIKLEDCGHIFEVDGLEQYFKISNESNDHKSVDVLKCPRCRQPVIQTLRYSTLIKEKFLDITNIKKRIFGDRKYNMENAFTLRNIRIPQIQARDNKGILFRCGLTSILKNITQQLQPIHEKRKRYKTVKVTAMQLSLFDSQIGIIELILDHLLEIYKVSNADADNETEIFTVAIEHATLIATVLEKQYNKLNQQQTNDLMLETKRLTRIRELAKLLSSDEYKANIFNAVIVDKKKKVFDIILSSKKFTLEYDYLVKQNLLEFEKLLKRHGGVSDEVKQEIVRAIQSAGGVKQGAWFKCPNGHYYVIGECGGAMVVGKCIECKADIGGSSHKLLSTNRHASEMDGGRPPWPPGP